MIQALTNGHEYEWTSVYTNKEYECENKQGDTPTMFWEADRTKSTFSMYCKEDGFYDFVDQRENWPTCLEDIECPTPPEIPFNEEYVHKKDFGRVNVRRYVYPLPPGPINEEFTMEYNNTLLHKNFDAKLV